MIQYTKSYCIFISPCWVHCLYPNISWREPKCQIEGAVIMPLTTSLLDLTLHFSRKTVFLKSGHAVYVFSQPAGPPPSRTLKSSLFSTISPLPHTPRLLCQLGIPKNKLLINQQQQQQRDDDASIMWTYKEIGYYNLSARSFGWRRVRSLICP